MDWTQTRPHRISKAWSTALLNEWTAQASIESEFGLPITVPSLNPADSKAQSKTQVGFIDLFAAPLFAAMAGVVDGESPRCHLPRLVTQVSSAEFADFAEKLRDGRAAWEAISLERDEAFQQPAADWVLAPAPIGRSRSNSSTPKPEDVTLPLPLETTTPLPSPPLLSSSVTTSSSPRPRPPGSRGNSYQRHLRQASDGSTTSSTNSPLSSYFPGSASFSSITTGISSLSIGPLWSTTPRFVQDPFQRFSCGGVCSTATATCETCSLTKDPDARRGSMVRGFTVALKGDDLDSMRYESQEEMMMEHEQHLHEWPPYPFQPT